jgi:Ca2+:H+ antiporter
MLNSLLIFAPLAIALEHLVPDQHLLIFLAAAIGLLPLAVWLGSATEQLAAERVRASGACSTPPLATPPN